MNKLKFLVIAAVFLSSAAYGQIAGQGAPSGKCNPPYALGTIYTQTDAAAPKQLWTCANNSASGWVQQASCPTTSALCGGTLTVATLPASPAKGVMAAVSDGASSSDCTVGSGSTLVTCQYNGSAWVQVAGSGGGGGNRYFPITGDAAQGLAGCSNDGNWNSGGPVTCYFYAGDATHPPQAFHWFQTAGAIGTGTSYYYRVLVPSNYTTDSNLTINMGIACPVATSGTVTFNVRYQTVTMPAAVQPALYSTDYSTGAVTVAGTINNWVTASAVLTPATGGSPHIHPGDLLYIAVYLSNVSASQTPYIYAYGSF